MKEYTVDDYSHKSHKPRFKFKHLRRGQFSQQELEGWIVHAFNTGQITTHRRSVVPFRSILKAEVVTICEYMEDGVATAAGYAFFRPDPNADPFTKEFGRWMSENRLRAQLNMELLPDPRVEKLRKLKLQKAKMKEEGLRRQVEIAAENFRKI